MRHTRVNDRLGWITIAGIFAPLLLLLVVGVMTWRSERRYAAVTTRVAHDYAAIAAWQYARRANGALHDEAMDAFRGIMAGHQRTARTHELASPERILAARTDSSAPLLRRARFAFTFDAATGQWRFAGDSVDVATRRMLERRVSALSRVAKADAEPHRVLFDSSSGRAHTIALWTIGAADMPMRGAYGIVADAEVLVPKLTAIISESSLLPAIGKAASLGANDLAIRLVRDDGAIVFATSPPLGATAATDTAGLSLSALKTIVDIPPHVVNALLVGGAPASQLPALGLMIAVAAALALLGLRHEMRTRELTRLRTRFVANVSHELRTPLAQISMFAETLSLGRERTAEERRHFAEIIFAEARRLTNLVEGVLRFSRGDAEAERLHVEPLSLRTEIEGAVASFAPIGEAADAHIEIEDSDAHALLDRAAFRQIVLNLLDNAVKHGGPGTRIRLAAVTTASEARVIVDDTGPGIPAEWRERIFEAFARVESTRVAGAGIGLAVVRDLVEAHGGRVWTEPSPAGGARFVVAVPRVNAEPEDARELAQATT